MQAGVYGILYRLVIVILKLNITIIIIQTPDEAIFIRVILFDHLKTSEPQPRLNYSSEINRTCMISNVATNITRSVLQATR